MEPANPEHPRRKWHLVAAIGGALLLSLLVTNGSLTGAATGGGGCQGGVVETPGVDLSNVDAEADCDEQAIATHDDPLAVLQAQVFDPLCVSCHQPDNLSGNLDLSSAQASYDGMVGIDAANTVAAENGWRLVVPGDPERSFLLRKLGSPGVGEGAPMPPGTHVVASVYQELLTRWIAEGAMASEGKPTDDLAACERLETRVDTPMNFEHPQTACAECHAQYVEEWETSNHAYAAKDPVFHAMVHMGQEVTQGKLGQFCVQCHTPVGMATGQTEVYLDETSQIHKQDVESLDDIAVEGVSCDVCHSITTVMEPHNARMVLSPNGVRRGTIADPVDTTAHASAYSELHGSSDLCSSCHAVTNPKGALVEETFQEWAESEAAAKDQTCQDCHMPSYQGRAAPDAPERTLHRHTFVGVDVSLLPPDAFPGYYELREKTAALLRTAARMDVAVEDGELLVHIENQAGHALPSGATVERQLWLEVIVRDAAGEIVLESGTLDENGNIRDPFEAHTTQPGTDPMLSWFNQHLLLDEVLPTLEGDAVAARRAELTAACDQIYHGDMPEGVQVVTFPWQANWQCNYMIRPDETVTQRYPLPDAQEPYEVSVALLFRGFPPYFLSKLEEAGGLDPEVKTRVPLVRMAESHIRVDQGVLVPIDGSSPSSDAP